MAKIAEKQDILGVNLEATIVSLENENRRLKDELEWLKRQIFGQKSERFVDATPENEILPGLNLSGILPDSIGEIIVPLHKRRKKNGGKNQFKVDIPDDLPREKEYKDIPESSKFDSKTGEELVKIGEETV